jgi:ParB/RepB/Spo0J family partition protein
VATDPTPTRTTLKDILRGAAATGPGGTVATGEGRLLPLDAIEPNPLQHRTYLDPEKLDELVDSIRTNGQVQAITVRRHPSDPARYQLIAGERRWRALQLLRERASAPDDKARWGSILAVEKMSVSDRQMRIYALVENADRADSSPVDQGASLAQLQEQESLTIAQLAEGMGWEENRVKRLLRAARAAPVIRDGMTKGLMVPLLSDDGQLLTTPTGRAKQEHRHLELMAALEFDSLLTHWARQYSPAKAEERVHKAILRALQEGWSFRRIQEFCREAKTDRRGQAQDHANNAGAGDETSPAPATPAPFTNDERQLVVYRSRLGGASLEQKHELRVLLASLLETLEPVQ